MNASPRLVLLDSAGSHEEPGGALLFAIQLDAKKEPPTEFRILAAGTTQTTKGPVLMSAAGGNSVLAKMAELGRDRLNFDYGHAQLQGPQSYEAARSAGWFNVEVREGELWATNVEWTPTARKALSEREFRYFSPALYLDRQTGEVRELINIALTNIPATKHQTPLVASQTEENPMDPELKALLASMGVMNLSQLAVKCQTALSDNAKLLAASTELSTQVATLTAQVNALTGAKATADKATYIAKLTSDGKLPPALAEWAADQSIESLQAYAAKAPVVAAANPEKITTPNPGNTDVTAATLSADELEICKQMNIKVEDYVATKKELLAGPTFWAYDPNASK
jgi:phage I-like protein